jgi:DNA-binding MurR/RpiR family transcriptional regulator
MFRDKIKAHYNELTPSFRKLADFILENQLEATFMTATEMARQLNVDAATVVRFSQTVGYSGFRELIKEIQAVVKAELVASYTVDLDASDDVGLLRSLMEAQRHNISLTQAKLTDRANTILPELVRAHRIWVVGQGCCAHLAALCAASLRELGLQALPVGPNPLEAAANLKGVGGEDVVLGLSLTGLDFDVANVVRFAHARGARTIVFSASETSEAALVGEVVVVCPGGTQTQLPSFASLAAMVDAVAAAYTVRYAAESRTTRERFEASYREMVALQNETTAAASVEDLLGQL